MILTCRLVILDEKEKKLVSFDAVDVTNYKSLKLAFDKIDGKVCITTEGLIIYLLNYLDLVEVVQ